MKKSVRNGSPSHKGVVLTRATNMSVTVVSKLVTGHIYRKLQMTP